MDGARTVSAPAAAPASRLASGAAGESQSGAPPGAARSAPVPEVQSDRILILDFGGQYTQLIARRVREARVYCEVLPHDADLALVEGFGALGIILSGGPESVVDPASVRAPQRVFDLGVPVLGICYGMQTMAAQLGGRVETSGRREYGHAVLRCTSVAGPLLEGLVDGAAPGGGARLDVWMSHGDRVLEMPPGFRLLAATDNTPIAAIADEERRFYGVQFHPEVTHTPRGQEIIDRFVHRICGCRALWSAQGIIEEAIRSTRERTGGGRVLLALSGGVDSSVAAALLHRAIGDRLTAIFVDTGLLRRHEGDQVMATLAEHLGVEVVRVDAGTRFFAALEGVADPERKRKIIGNLFIEIFEEAAKRIEGVEWLAQGTIYPDVIESAGASSGKAHVIKSHHNVGGLPQRMRLRLLEPLRELFKDEVRALGRALGLPREMVCRHPFPGPGLGVRVLGEVNAHYVGLLRRADAIFIEELRRHGWYERVSQAFAVYLPVRSVGVMGDARRYEHVIAIRAVETSDFMTARWAHLPYPLLDTVSRRIINEVPGISRVAYDISGKPPATVEWE